ERTAARITESAPAQGKALTVPVIGLQLPPSEPAPNAADPARPESAQARPETATTESIPPTRTPRGATASLGGGRPVAGSSAPMAAIRGPTLTGRAATGGQTAAMAALPPAAAGAGRVPAAHAAPAAAPIAAAPAAPVAPAPVAAAAPPAQYQTASAIEVPAAAPPAAPAASAPVAAPASAQTTEPLVRTASLSAAAAKLPPRAGWTIQIGAFPDENEARERLQSAQSIAKGLLGKADPYTERVTKGNETLYRARFAGLDESGAEAACRLFKRNKIACFTVKN